MKWRQKYPIRSWPVKTPDGTLYDFEIKVDDRWLPVVNEARQWDEAEADEAFQKYQKTKNQKKHDNEL
jgi:hypothetical protein